MHLSRRTTLWPLPRRCCGLRRWPIWPSRPGAVTRSRPRPLGPRPAGRSDRTDRDVPPRRRAREEARGRASAAARRRPRRRAEHPRGRGPVVGLADNVRDAARSPVQGNRHQARAGGGALRRCGTGGGARYPGRVLRDGQAGRRGAPRELLPLQPRRSRILPTEPSSGATCAFSAQRYPWVQHFSTWNEQNFRAQPTSRDPPDGRLLPHPERRVLGRALHGADLRLQARRHCSLRALAGDVQARIGPGRHIWGLAPYVDANRRSTKLTRDFLARTSGPCGPPRWRR